MKRYPRLGVNIDHVATLRQARGESYPSLPRAAQLVMDRGADQITIHLREDRRHIQDVDVEMIAEVTRKFKRPLNLEMSCVPEIVEVAEETKPQWVCLVPEKREEKTTEGGLDLCGEKSFKKVAKTCEELKSRIKGVKISLFVECDEEVLRCCSCLGADAVEIHTGDFARAYLEGKDLSSFFEQYRRGYNLSSSLGMGYHAGHGLTSQSTLLLLREGLFSEYNIGHWIVSHALFIGLGNVVENLKREFQSSPLKVE